MSPALISALIAALVGGVIGSAITAWSSVAIARSQRREKAATALWNYHYSLSALAAQAAAAFGPSEEKTLLKADFKDVAKALHDAYPYAGYLGTRARKHLFRNPWVFDISNFAEWHDAAQQKYNEYSRLATRLEIELEWVFPRRFWDPLRSFWRRLRGGKR